MPTTSGRFLQSVPSGGPAQLKGVFAGWFVDVIALIKFRVPVQLLSSILANGVIDPSVQASPAFGQTDYMS